MNQAIAKNIRKTARKQTEELKAREADIAKGFLVGVCKWKLKDRISMAWRIVCGKYKAK